MLIKINIINFKLNMKYFIILELVDLENLLKIPRESLVNNSLNILDVCNLNCLVECMQLK